MISSGQVQRTEVLTNPTKDGPKTSFQNQKMTPILPCAPATCDEDSATSSQYESEPTNDLYQMMVNGSLNNMDTLDAMCSKPLADREIISLICDLRSSVQFSIVEQAELNKTIRTLNLELKEQASTSATLVARADAENLKSYREISASRIKAEDQRKQYLLLKRRASDLSLELEGQTEEIQAMRVRAYEERLASDHEISALHIKIKSQGKLVQKKDEQLKLSETKMDALIKQSAEEKSNLFYGAAATGAACTSNGANICTSCSSGYYKNGNSCSGCRSACGTGTRETTSCSSSSNRVCTSNSCSCTNGAAATGAACTSNGASICTSCNSGYDKTGNTCVARSRVLSTCTKKFGASANSNGCNCGTSVCTEEELYCTLKFNRCTTEPTPNSLILSDSSLQPKGMGKYVWLGSDLNGKPKYKFTNVSYCSCSVTTILLL